MAFKRKENTVEAVDLSLLTPPEVERKIIDAVRKYATRQDNWAGADKNTSFLGSVTGMGIESSNHVDIVMNIERLFLTRKTKRVPVNGGPEFTLEDGELGKLVILDGQDIFSATPGLAVKMLMDYGHMAKDEAYLQDVVSFAYVVVIGAAYRLDDSLRKGLAKLGRTQDPAGRKEAAANLKALLDQARDGLKTLRDPGELSRSRQEAYAKEKNEFDEIKDEAAAVAEQLKERSSSTDTGALERLRSRQAELRLRIDSKKLMLRVSEKVAAECGSRAAVEEAKVQEVRRILAASAEIVSERLSAPEAEPCNEPSPETMSSISATLSAASISHPAAD